MVQLRREQPNRKLSGTWRRVTRWTTCLPLAVAASHPATTLLTFTAAQTGAPTSSFDGTLLDGGNLATRNNVQEFADFALDLRDMRKNASDKQTVQNIYKQGSNAKSTDGSLISLQSLSEIYSSSTLLDVTPNILYHMYGLTSDMDPSSTLAARFTAIEQYQSSHIEKVILGDHTDLAADAVIALSMWTYATYLLHSTIWNCQVRTDADNPSVLVNNKELDHIDKFIALWMGSEQTSGNSDGHAMYDWVRRVNGLFGSTSPEAAVNTKIKLLYQEGATYLGLPDACTLESPKTVEALWNIAAQIIREMMKPLFQWLVYSLVVESPIESELYALALIPQLSRCRPSLYNRLAEAIRTGIQVSNKDSILRDLVEAYTSCLGHPCQDLSLASVSNDHPALSCEGITDDSTPPVLAGYRASSAVAPLSRIDLDIRQIRILSTMESMSYAKLTYEFGYNVETPRDSENDPFSLVSLQQLAVSTIRAQAVPYYTYFVEYFNEKNYADKRMRLVLDGQSKWTATAHKTEALVLTSAFQIVYMEVLFHLSDAVNKCDAIVAQGGSTFAVALETDRHPIDNIAALLIGSLEGSQEGGSFPEDGELVWNLANKRAFQFQTMNEEEFAIVNQELMNLLFAAKGEMDGLACSKLRTTTEKISRYMQVGLIQSIIHAAIESQDFESNSLHVSLAQGDVLTDSLLPIIVANAADPGELIKQNMIFQAGEDTVKDGAQAVADVLGFYMTSKAYIPCEHVGASGGVNPCAKSGSAARSVHAWTVFLIASTASLICVLLT